MPATSMPPGDPDDPVTADAATLPDLTTVIVKGAAPGAGPDDRAHYLVVTEGEGAGRRIELGARPIVIGRMAPADIVLPDTQISRKHCRVGMVLDDVFVTDLGSSNGTYVDGARIEGTAILPVGGRLRVGNRTLEHEWRARREVQASKALDHDLENASRYVRSLIPPPLESGPIRAEWVLLPSARLGGDVFGYHPLDEHRFAIYLLDVSGHGTGPAMHAVSVMNVIRGRAMPGVDAGAPARVAECLNAMFPMRSHGGLYFSMWYGVYDRRTRRLAYCSAGHHPSYLVAPDRREAVALRVPNVALGVAPSPRYAEGSVQVASGASLYVFSDGVYEVETREGAIWGLEGLAAALVAPRQPGVPETRRIEQAVRAAAKSPAFDDDFSMVIATFE
jgi:serine phosphatase RsbU (regulator of sigma subunit)